MKIKDIRPGMEGITLVARVLSVGEPKRVMTKFGIASVANAIISDETGKVVLNLWRNQINLVKPGYIIKVENAFAKKFKNRVELNVGKRGRILVLRKA